MNCKICGLEIVPTLSFIDEQDEHCITCSHWLYWLEQPGVKVDKETWFASVWSEFEKKDICLGIVPERFREMCNES